MTEQSQVLDGARVLLEVVAADLFGAQRPVGAQCLEGRLDACYRPLGQRPLFQILVEPLPHSQEIVLVELLAPVAVVHARIHHELGVDAA